MDYSIFIDLVARTVAIALAIYFIFILLAGDSKYKRHSLVLVVYSVVYFFMPSLDQDSLTYKADYLQAVDISMMIEGAAGLAMAYFLSKDSLAKYHAGILVFAIVCHFMVYYKIKGDPEWIQAIAYGFHAFYDELIIIVGLLQMAVSKNGITTAYNNAPGKLQNLVFWAGVCSNHLRKSLLSRKKREIKT